MNRYIVLLSVALAGSVAAAILLGRDIRHERARADALAERLIELEPLERASSSNLADADHSTQAEASAPVPEAVDPSEPPSTQSSELELPKPVKDYRGTLRTRQQVERLQAALAGGTPLQEYQIQPLIAAIDEVRSEIEQERAKDATTQHAARNIDWDAEANERIVQEVDDILFESQLDKFMQLLDDELDVPQTN